MEYQQGQDRWQLTLYTTCLDDMVGQENTVKAINRVFRATVSVVKNHDLNGATLLAGDSTKLRAQNSKKNNYNKKKVARHLEYIDKKLAQHAKELAKADGEVYPMTSTNFW
jgi:beta-galactosidase beta subunit